MISLFFIFLFEFYWWKWVFLLLMEMGVSFCWNLNLEYNFKLWKLLLADHLAGIYGTWFSFLFSLFIPFLKLIVTQLCCKWWLSQWDLTGVVLLFEIFLIYWVKKRYPLFHKILKWNLLSFCVELLISEVSRPLFFEKACWLCLNSKEWRLEVILELP